MNVLKPLTIVVHFSNTRKANIKKQDSIVTIVITRHFKRRVSFCTNSQCMKGWSFNVTNAITKSLGKSIYKNTERKCTHYLSTMLQLSHKDLFLINPLLSIDDCFFFTLRNWHFQSILVVLCSHALDLDIGFILTLLLFGESLDLVPNLVQKKLILIFVCKGEGGGGRNLELGIGLGNIRWCINKFFVMSGVPMYWNWVLDWVISDDASTKSLS